MSESKLQIAEMFYSVQGEGPHAGTPAVFVRLAGCNLQCGKTESNILEVDPQQDEPDGDATWICDTIDVWRQPDDSYTSEEMFEEFKARGWWDAIINDNAHIVLTGGEPTLPQHQKAFVEFIDYVYGEFQEFPFVEVETNGTQELLSKFKMVVDTFNCSMKLSNSGHSYDERVQEDVQQMYVEMTESELEPFVKWKFVVSDSESLEEITELVETLDIPDECVSLMPAGQTREQLQESYPEVAEIVKETGWDFTPRLHVNIWDEQTGV